MSSLPALSCRYFSTYSGVTLPLQLRQELEAGAIAHRNTFFRAYYDASGRMVSLQKVVYGEIELEHRYTYGLNDELTSAEIIDEEGTATLLTYGAG